MTRQQHALLNFIACYISRTGYSPSYQEMQDALGLASKSSVARLVEALRRRGLVSREHHGARSVRLSTTGNVHILPVVRITPKAMEAATAGAAATGKSLTDYVSSCIHYYGVGHR